MSRRKTAPWVVFGCGDKANKATFNYVDKTGNAHLHICQLKDDADYERGLADIELDDVAFEYAHLLFCKEESLRSFKMAVDSLLEKMEVDT